MTELCFLKIASFLKSIKAHKEEVYNYLCSKFYKMLNDIKKYSTRRFREKNSGTEFSKRISDFGFLKKKENENEGEVHLQITEIEESERIGIELAKQKMVKKINAKSTKLDEITQILLNINDAMDSFTQNVFQQEIRITESILISRQNGCRHCSNV